MKNNRAETFLHKLVEELGEYANNSQEEYLPPLRQLSQDLKVSIPSLSKALGVLKSRGLLSFRKGQRPRIVKNLSKLAKPVSLASDLKLANELKRQISTGEIRSGQQLPKMTTIAESHAVSLSTIQKTLSKLSAENMAHKNGKHWFVGPQPGKPLYQKSKFRPKSVIVIVQDDFHTLTALCTSLSTNKFFYSFESEMARYNVGLQFAIINGSNPPKDVGPEKFQGIKNLIRSLGKKHMGTLVLMRKHKNETIYKLGVTLARFSRPVVVLDRNESLHFPKKHPGLFLCVHKEKPLVELCTEALTKLGHKHVAFLETSGIRQDWIEKRKELLNEAGNNKNLTITYLKEKQSASVHSVKKLLSPKNPGYSNISNFNIEQPKSEHLPKLEQILKVLREKKITAIIAPRDQMAEHYFSWLQVLQIKIPAQLSLLSFDNRPSSQVTSIDHGFDYLGYAAFHLLFGVLPVEIKNNNTIENRPTIRDKGTLGWVPNNKINKH